MATSASKLLGTKAAAKPAAKSTSAKLLTPKTVTPASNVTKAGSMSTRTPEKAAQDLHAYIQQKGANLGSKGKPGPMILRAQQDMGGVTADGIFGPNTRARMNTLLASKPAAMPVQTPAPIIAAASLAPPAPAAAVVAAKKAAAAKAAAPPPAPVYEPEPEPEPEPEAEYYEPEAAPAVSAPVKQAIAAIPADNKAEIIEALNQFSAQPQASQADYTQLLDQLSAKFGAQLREISSAAEAQLIQRQATSEHNALMKADERWAANNTSQQAILDKLTELVKILMANNSISKRVYEVYGVHL